jgi:membrane-anchored glycerophosphoryl diester phosphodiesterase (GDPDase)
VTDTPQWQAPGSGPTSGDASTPVPPPGTPPIAPPVGPPIQPPPAAGWTPPPKPGLIPLRPLDLGTILGASFRVLRRNPRPTFGASLAIQGIVAVVSVVVIGLVGFATASRLAFSTEQNVSTIQAGTFGIIGLSALVPLALSLVASALLQGIIVLEVSRGTLGEKQKFGQLWRRARGRIGALIGWTALVALVVVVVLGVLVGLIVLFVTTLGVAGIVIGVLLGIFGLLGLLVLYFWLNTRLSLVPSAIMIERLSIRAAMARSWSLTKGYFWRTLGIELLVAVILNTVTSIITTPLSFIAPLIIQLTDPNGQNGATTIIITIGITILTLIVSIVFSAITSVVSAATAALLYIDLRMRHEGLDLELARYVEARQAGDATIADPYLPVVPAPTS